MYFNSILCICFAAITLTFGNESQDGVQPNGDASYEFGYDIHNPLSNDIKSHHEIRDGKNVLGFYTFKEADGTIRIVKYKVTPDTGFEAIVEKINPDPINGNAIDGQETAQSIHGAAATVIEQNPGHNSQYVAGIAPHTNSREKAPALIQGAQNRNPYIIRRNPHHRFSEEGRHGDVPRGRQRNQQFTQQPNNRQLHVQEALEHHRHRFSPHARNQVGQYANNPVQPTGPIVYIDGIPYIDDIGYTDMVRNGQIATNDQVYVPDLEQVVNDQNDVQNDSKDGETDKAASNVDDNNNNNEQNKEDIEEEEDDDDENAEYEEEDDDILDDDDFYEENDKLLSHQQREYDLLKKAYEADGEEPKEEEKVEEKQSEVPVHEKQLEDQ